MEKNNITTQDKIFKSANNNSTIDVQAALIRWKTTKKSTEAFKEDEYKGKIVFNITEHMKGKESQHATAFVDKASAKAVFNSIIHNTFSSLFPKSFASYGGSKTDRGIEARTFAIRADDTGFWFVIESGIGEMTATGAFKMKKSERKVQKKVGKDEILKMAHEIVSYIQAAEIAGMIKGKPLVTRITSVRDENQSFNNSSSNSSTQTQPQRQEPVETQTQPTGNATLSEEEKKRQAKLQLLEKLENADISRIKDDQLDHLKNVFNRANGDREKNILTKITEEIEKREAVM